MRTQSSRYSGARSSAGAGSRSGTRREHDLLLAPAGGAQPVRMPALQLCDDPGSRTPRRVSCQPDLVKQALTEAADWPALAAGNRAARQTAEAQRVRPLFNSVRYGTNTYCQLAPTSAPEITGGSGRRIRDGRLSRSVSAAARGEPARPACRILAGGHGGRPDFCQLGDSHGPDDLTRCARRLPRRFHP